MSKEKKDSVDKLDEAIEKISKELADDDEVNSELIDVIEEEVEEDEELHDTKEIENLENFDEDSNTSTTLENNEMQEDKTIDSDNDINEEEIKDEVKEEVIKELKEEEEEEKQQQDLKKKKKKKIIIIVSIAVLLVAIITTILILVFKKEKVTNEKVSYTTAQQKKIIENYGKKLESITEKYYKQQKLILKYEDAVKLVDYNYKVVCKEHEVYDEGKIYINKCKIDGKSTLYSYGVKKADTKNSESVSLDSPIVTKLNDILQNRINFNTKKLYQTGSYNISEMSNENLLYTVLRNIDMQNIAFCIGADDSLKSPVSYDYLNDTLKKYILNEKITENTIRSLDKSKAFPLAQYDLNSDYGFVLSDYGVQIIGSCHGGYGFSDTFEVDKVVKAEKTDEYLYIYKKVAFGKISNYSESLVDYYKDYNRLNVVESNVKRENTNAPNYDLYYTYRFDFKIIGGNYYFQSAQFVG